MRTYTSSWFGDYDCQRAYLRAMLFGAVYDSIYRPIVKRARKASTKRHNKWKKDLTDREREAAREWMRAGSPASTATGDGFGYVWSMIQMLCGIEWELDQFLERMERLWATCDANPEVGRRIITTIRGIREETLGGGVVIDREFEFAAAIGEE